MVWAFWRTHDQLYLWSSLTHSYAHLTLNQQLHEGKNEWLQKLRWHSALFWGYKRISVWARIFGTRTAEQRDIPKMMYCVAAVHTVMWSNTDVVQLRKSEQQSYEMVTQCKKKLIYNAVFAEHELDFWGLSCFRWRKYAYSFVLYVLNYRILLENKQQSTNQKK